MTELTLGEQLEPKLAEIERLAKWMYQTYHLYERRRMIVREGTAQLEWAPPIPGRPLAAPGDAHPEASLSAEQTVYNTFLRQIEDLRGKFRTYYSLVEPAEFESMNYRLGRATTPGAPTEFPVAPSRSALASKHPLSILGVQPDHSSLLRPPTVVEQLASSYTDWMAHVDALVTSGQWRGGAADAFITGFQQPFLRAGYLQAGYAQELNLAAKIFHDAISNGRADILKIADLCIAELNLGPGGVSLPSDTTLTVVGIIASAAGVYGPLNVPAAIVGVGAGLTSLLPEEAKAEETGPYEIAITGGSAGDAKQVIESTWDAIVMLDGLLAGVDLRLYGGLRRDLSDTRAFANPALNLERPALANRSDAAKPLGDLDIQDRAGGRNAVVVELVKVYQAGKVNLPAAASLYDGAHTSVDECTIPAALNEFFPLAIPKFDESRDRLAGYLRKTRDSLNDAGKALVHAAEAYRITDTARAQLLCEIGKLDPNVGTPQIRGD